MEWAVQCGFGPSIGVLIVIALLSWIVKQVKNE